MAVTAFTVVVGLALLLAVLVSALADRSPLSTTVVFLAVGLASGPLGIDVIEVAPHTVEVVSEIALFAILFVDGQHASLAVLRRSWREPTRALALGMPITFVLVTLGARFVVGLDWSTALVLGAVLAPTDPVFASALVGREEVPQRVRTMLNIESGVNDGLALPAVLFLAAAAGGAPEGWSTDPLVLLAELAIGVLLGIVIPLLVHWVLKIPGVGMVERLQPLGPLAVAVLLWGACSGLHANQFLAAFAAGATIATVRPSASHSFRATGELVTEMVKGGALVAFAALLDRDLLGAVGLGGVVLALLVVPLSRPLALWPATIGAAELNRPERMAVAWFGPKGFASVAYAVIVLSSDMPGGEAVFVLATLSVLVSVVLHSTADVPVARWLRRQSHAAEVAPD